MKKLDTIDDVLDVLDEIILISEQTNDTLGYFAVLYRRVTWKVKEGISTGFFDEAERMEKLDIIFAKRYIDAYYEYRNKGKVNNSWETAFTYSREYWAVVLQHLLIGMNAHINLDLGIAAARVSGDNDIEALQGDFYKINAILAGLVNEVQQNLSTIWFPLRKLLLKTGQMDNLLVDFSMEIARDGAWRFAQLLSTKKGIELEQCIATRDEAIAGKANLITNPGRIAGLGLKLIRLGERGSVSEKIKKLQYIDEDQAVEKTILTSK